MKCSSASLSWSLAGLLIAAVSASPLLPRAEPQTVYRLKVVAPAAATALNGRYLSIDDDGTVGIFGHVGPDTAPRFYSTKAAQAPGGGGDQPRIELHGYPAGAVDHALALVGSGPGLLTLKDVANPTRAAFPEGSTADWQSFTLGGGTPDPTAAAEPKTATAENQAAAAPAPSSSSSSSSPPTDALSYAGALAKGGKWLAFQKGASSFAVKWYDGTSMITQDYRTISIVSEVVTD